MHVTAELVVLVGAALAAIVVIRMWTAVRRVRRQERAAAGLPPRPGILTRLATALRGRHGR